MPNESPNQARAREMVENKHRTRRAAAQFRTDVAAGLYAGLPARLGDRLWRVAAVLDTAEIQLGELPEQHRRAILDLVGDLLEDEQRKTGPTPPLSAGDGV